MGSYNDRAPGSDGKIADDKLQETRAATRRNRMLGEWAARLMGLQNVDDYARVVVKSETDPPSDEDVLRKVSQDLAGSGLSTPVSEVRAKMDEYLAIARGKIQSGE